VEAVEDLRQLGEMPEGVRDVTNHHTLTEELADVLPDQQVTHKRFRGDEKFIRQDVPGTDEDALFLDVLLQAGQVCHAHLQVIFEYDRLSIQHEMQVIRVRIQDNQEIIHEVDELQAELLEGLIPFAIPMGMGNNMQGLHSLSSGQRIWLIMPQGTGFGDFSTGIAPTALLRAQLHPARCQRFPARLTWLL